MSATILIFLQLLIAHILTDFVLQPTTWILHKRKHKIKSVYLLLHALIAGILSYLFLQQWEMWMVPLFIFVTHFFIDLWKLNTNKDNLTYFLLDQFFHIIAIVLAWLYLINAFDEIGTFFRNILNSPEILIVFIAYLVVIFPVGFLVGKATERWRGDLEKHEGEENSLKSAGRYIGIFERILVLTFILMGNFAAIGFLIAAKSILRFNDKSMSGSRKQTEYVLIGTLMSFTISILLGILVRESFLK
ncbi:MAG TPA: DUF3307 domain-containing protein [Flavobacteriaceae bacterium]|nr:DUF3307 domain-containing protein [Flavobacteriaceae bacterium]